MTKRLCLGLFFGAFALAGCSDFNPFTDSSMLDGSADRVVVENDPAVLAQRFAPTMVELAVEQTTAQLRGGPAPGDRDGDVFKLFLIATVDPPVVRDITLQATHIVVRGNRVLVSYNVQGPDRAGGADIFDITDPDDVTLVAGAIFTDTDVSALDLHSNTVFLAEATSDGAFSSPATLETLHVREGLTDESRRIDLPSYAGTGVVVQGETVYVTSGDLDGGISAYDRETLELQWFSAIPDARAVDARGATVIVMRGTPGALHVFDGASGSLLRTFETGGANIPESKATVQVARGLAFYAAGDEGLRVVDMDNGTVVANVPVPDIEGLDPEFEVTNAVSLQGNLVFMANGGAGLQVVRANTNVEAGADLAASDLQLQRLGNVIFPDGESANFVGGKGNLAFSATGTGGLHIIKIVHQNQSGGRGGN